MHDFYEISKARQKEDEASPVHFGFGSGVADRADMVWLNFESQLA